MKESQEFEYKEENPDGAIKRKLVAEGWEFIANERTHAMVKNQETSILEPKEVRKAVSIEEEYLKNKEGYGFKKAKLVRPHIPTTELNWVEDPYSYDVYMIHSGEQGEDQ